MTFPTHMTYVILRAVEPGHAGKEAQEHRSREIFKPSTEPGTHSPTVNFLLTREMPVPVKSRLGQSSVAIVDSDVEPDDPLRVQEETGRSSSEGTAGVSATEPLGTLSVMEAAEKDDDQVPAEIRDLCQSNPLSDPATLMAGIEELKSASKNN